jgi:hypothetical protein
MAADAGEDAIQSMRTTPQPPRDIRRAGGVDSSAESGEMSDVNRMLEKNTWETLTLTARISATELVQMLSSLFMSQTPSISAAICTLSPPAAPTDSPSPPPRDKNSRKEGGRTLKMEGNAAMQRPERLIFTSAAPQTGFVSSRFRRFGSSHMVLPVHAESRMLCRRRSHHSQHVLCITNHLNIGRVDRIQSRKRRRWWQMRQMLRFSRERDWGGRVGGDGAGQ